jgi:acylphosphatase
MSSEENRVIEIIKNRIIELENLASDESSRELIGYINLVLEGINVEVLANGPDLRLIDNLKENINSKLLNSPLVKKPF